MCDLSSPDCSFVDSSEACAQWSHYTPDVNICLEIWTDDGSSLQRPFFCPCTMHLHRRLTDSHTHTPEQENLIPNKTNESWRRFFSIPTHLLMFERGRRASCANCSKWISWACRWAALKVSLWAAGCLTFYKVSALWSRCNEGFCLI